MLGFKRIYNKIRPEVILNWKPLLLALSQRAARA
jgi:hypothetical protein